jgi:hypothetical protein
MMDHRESGAVSVWQEYRELSGAGAAPKLLDTADIVRDVIYQQPHSSKSKIRKMDAVCNAREASRRSTRETLAPWWHSALVLAALGVLSVAAGYQKGVPNAHIPGLSSKLSGYLTIFLAEWFLSIADLAGTPTARAYNRQVGFRTLGNTRQFLKRSGTCCWICCRHYCS